MIAMTEIAVHDRTAADRRQIRALFGENAFPIAMVAIVVAALGQVGYALIVADTWMTLAMGREVIEHGLPQTEEITVLGRGADWVDQQWLAQVLWYGVEQAFGLAGVTVLGVLAAAGVWAVAMAGARSLGASARAVFLVAVPALIVAPWTLQIRAQTWAVLLYPIVLALAAGHVRSPSRRVLLALPLLVLWANLHGSVLLGALLISLAGVWAAVRDTPLRRLSIGMAVAAWLCVLVTPYGLSIAEYYRLMLVDPPFAEAITEWQRTSFAGITAPFYVAAVLVVGLAIWKRTALTWFELVVLALTLVGAFQALRGITWFALSAVVLLPNALDQALGGRRAAARGRIPTTVAAVAVAIAIASLVSLARQPSSWTEREWPTNALTAVEARPDALVFASDRHADWLLWRIPSLRGRLAFDVRFEVLTRDEVRDLIDFTYERGPGWKQVADGYELVVLDVTDRPSHLADFSTVPGSRIEYRDRDVWVISRAA